MPLDWSALHSTAFLLFAMAACEGLLDDPAVVCVAQRLSYWPTARSDRLQDVLESAHHHLFEVHGRVGSGGLGAAVLEHVQRLQGTWGAAIHMRLLADLTAVAKVDGAMTGEEVHLLMTVGSLLRGTTTA